MAVVRGDSAVRRRGVRWAMLAIAATVVAADQVSKTLVLRSHLAAGTGWAAVRLVRNTGASGGIAAGYPVLVTLAAVLIAGAAGALALRARGRGIAICLAAVLGGALGNLSDRLFRSPGFGRGAVVDWIHFGGSGSFNVADMAIQFGVLAAVVVMFASEHAGKVTRAETKA
jgi:signal peptidase II